MDLAIGDVARRTGLTERTLRYYEELGLLAPARDGAGRRRYDAVQLDRLYRVRLLRGLGVALADLDPDGAPDSAPDSPDDPPHDLLDLSRRHLADLDARLADLARQRERVRAVEDRLLGGARPTDEALLDVLAGLTGDEPAATRRVTLLVYRDLAAAYRFLVEVLGLAPGRLDEVDGVAVHGEVHAGDGTVWLHRESTRARLASPATLGAATACLAVHVDDVEAHHARARAAGAAIDYAPTDMPYGVREYGVRDSEDHLWSFQQPVHDREDARG